MSYPVRVPVIEAYGVTEAAHQIASNPLPPRERKAGSVGLPAGCEISTIDDGGRVPVSSSASKFDLTLGMRETKQGLEGRLIYSTDLFDSPTIKRMAAHFCVLLEAILTNPEQRLSDLPLLTEADRHQLLLDWNDTTKDYPNNKHPCAVRDSSGSDG